MRLFLLLFAATFFWINLPTFCGAGALSGHSRKYVKPSSWIEREVKFIVSDSQSILLSWLENSGQAEYVELSMRMFCSSLLSNNPEICSLAAAWTMQILPHHNYSTQNQKFHYYQFKQLIISSLPPHIVLHSWKQANNGVTMAKRNGFGADATAMGFYNSICFWGEVMTLSTNSSLPSEIAYHKISF